MLTGSLENKVKAIWQDFYNNNITDPYTIVNQLTPLMFAKMLDDKQNAVEAQANIIGIKPDQKILTFRNGKYTNYGDDVDRKKVAFTIDYQDLRWKNFKNLNGKDLFNRLKNYVIPFLTDTGNKAVGAFPEFSKNYVWGFDSKPRLVTLLVDKLSDDEFDFTNNDIMGDVYEYMCGSGLSGQYRTPRHIIDMSVEMMKPKLGEKIIDPAMGTAGFIIESAKYVAKHQKKELLNQENKKKYANDMFYGSDNDTNMARIGYMNCILHDITNPNISVDSFLEFEYAKNYLNRFDLVLQNPPFAGSLDESTLNEKLLTITKTKKTELLFVTLMVQLLKLGGRGMSIVPDGVLFGSDKAHIALRKELVDHQKLIGIISMPQGIFMAPSKKGSASKGAGVKTSFIIFQRTDKGGTDNVWFYDMANDGFTLDVKRTPIEGSDIPDIIDRFNHLNKESDRERTDKSFMVPVKEIQDNNYDLTINKYKKVIREVVKYRKTSEILKDIEKLDKEEVKLSSSLKSLLKEGNR